MRRIVLGIAIAVTSLMPTLGVADDQQIADFIKSRLQVEQQKGNLRGFNVDMRVDRGTVWFKGHVSNDDQEMTILRAAQLAGHLGVVQVVDDIEVKQMAAPEQSVMAQDAIEAEPEADLPLPVAPAAFEATPINTQPPMAVNYQAELMNAAYQQQPQAVNPYLQTSRQEYIQSSAGAASGIMSGGQPLPFANNSAPHSRASLVSTWLTVTWAEVMRVAEHRCRRPMVQRACRRKLPIFPVTPGQVTLLIPTMVQ